MPLHTHFFTCTIKCIFISRWELSENVLSFHTIFHELMLSFISIYLNVLEVKLYKLRVLFCSCMLEQIEGMGNYDFDLKILNVSKIHCVMEYFAS